MITRDGDTMKLQQIPVDAIPGELNEFLAEEK